MLIGMSEAAKRLGLSGATPARVLLQRNQVPLVDIHARAYAVEVADLEAFMRRRRPRGRPRADSAPSPVTEQGRAV